MGSKIDPATREKIVRMFVEGYSYDEIAEATGVAKSTVADLIKQVKEGSVSPHEALSDYVDELWRVTSQLHQLHMTPGDALFGVHLIRRLLALGVDMKELDKGIRLFRRALDSKHPAQAYLRAGMRLMKLETTTGLTYEKLVESFEKTTRDLQAGQAVLAQVQEQVSASETRAKEMEDLLEVLNEASKDLIEVGVDGADLKATVTAAKALKEQGADLGGLLTALDIDRKLVEIGADSDDATYLTELLLAASREGFDARLVRALAEDLFVTGHGAVDKAQHLRRAIKGYGSTEAALEAAKAELAVYQSKASRLKEEVILMGEGRTMYMDGLEKLSRQLEERRGDLERIEKQKAEAEQKLSEAHAKLQQEREAAEAYLSRLRAETRDFEITHKRVAHAVVETYHELEALQGRRPEPVAFKSQPEVVIGLSAEDVARLEAERESGGGSPPGAVSPVPRRRAAVRRAHHGDSPAGDAAPAPTGGPGNPPPPSGQSGVRRRAAVRRDDIGQGDPGSAGPSSTDGSSP